MATNFAAHSRLMNDYRNLKRDPIPYVVAEPLCGNILEWHYVLQGPEDSPYQGGFYHGRLLFPDNFPFAPPKIEMITPSGRFQTNEFICLSISNMHPESWNPCWTVGTLLCGLLSFMIGNAKTNGTLESTEEEKKKLARESLNFNLSNSQFVELFPDTVNKIRLPPSNYECIDMTFESVHKTVNDFDFDRDLSNDPFIFDDWDSDSDFSM
ncbi:unnamed protein product [Meganyctiphanes norvegica]|uniref:UBC core domain-containing protein n=1 Tax=Meganyctiphanes norvegica TaxID=48144 RepID=A0AAV2RRA3_MEGNR